MSLIKLILSTMLLLMPAQMRPSEDSAQMETYRAIAQGINAAVDSPITELPFDGPAAKEASAIALVAIARNESDFNQKVRDCRVKGDNGRSISVFQLINGPGRMKHTEKEICEDDTLAARLSLNVLTWYRYTGSSKSLFQGYGTGYANLTSRGAKNQNDYFTWAIAKNKITISRKTGTAKMWAESTEPVVVSTADGTLPNRTAALSP